MNAWGITGGAMKITRCSVTGLVNSIVSCTLPVSTMYDADKFLKQSNDTGANLYMGKGSVSDATKIAKMLAADTAGMNGSFIKGIYAAACITAPMWWWADATKDNLNVVSGNWSTSCIASALDIASKNKDNSEVLKSIFGKKYCEEQIELLLKEWDKRAKKETVDRVAAVRYLLPAGMLVTRRVSISYYELRAIYNSRKLSKGAEWKGFCKWCENLPMGKDFIVQ